MNARSWLQKRDEFLAHIAVEKTDVIAITESWANSSHLMTEFGIAGYESYNKNRQHRKGGGVICYVKNTLSAIEIEKQETQNYDTVSVELTTMGNKKLMVVIVYRPPKQLRTDDTALYKEIQSIIRNTSAVIFGDFNCPSIKWNSMHGDQEGSRLIEMVEDSFLSQIVNQPTRGNNILDLLLTTDTDLITDCEVGEILSGCDHHMIRFRIRTKHQVTENKSKVPDYRNANFDLARELLFSEMWEQRNGISLDQEWSAFRDKLIEVERMTVPMKLRRLKGTTNPPWMTAEIRSAINVKKYVHNSMKETAMVETR